MANQTTQIITSTGLVPAVFSALTNSGQSVKSSSGTVFGWHLDNTPNSATTYFQFYNVTSPTVGTTTPFMTIGIPGGAAANVAWPQGITFSVAIVVAATTTATGGSAPSNNCTATIMYS